ncbi:hypothetical protein [Streptomyces sp. G7(2002)]|uniref:hypothetical protein n=1 Tax=Streptomyces sp. G7(2002) TaxID=2971798 RepID=UPI00237EA473|nr:hypothetical protein [Streptomyces sp. G7(2002)]WDT53602.1 hypothetical protein NUT86_05815 [Streptomyces sp. G7(2002)]
MQTLRLGRRRRVAVAALLLGAVISLTACGEQRGTSAAAGAPSASPSASPSSRPSSPGASPYVEPGVVDGAPHNGDNNAYRRSGEMSPAGAKEAQKEADRIEPVLKRLWRQKKWDPKSVRAALLQLGYEEERTGPKGERHGGNLTVRAMDPRHEADHYVTPEGAQVGLRVRKDACVTAFVQKTNYEVKTNGPFMETGCFEPPSGH